MVEALLSLPTFIGCGVAMIFTAVLGLLVYLISHKLITRYKSDDLRDALGGLFRVVGLLISLMLSLAFGEGIGELTTIKNAIDREVVSIADIFKDLEFYDFESTREIRTILMTIHRQ